MLKLRNPHLSQALYTLEFSTVVPKIRFEQQRAESAYGNLMQSQSQQTNVPDHADPSIPRIQFVQNAHKRIAISQARCQLQCSFGEGKPFLEQLAIFEKNAREFHKASIERFALVPFQLAAVIGTIQLPSDEDINVLHQYVYDRFLKIAPPSEIASAKVALGFKQGDHFVNLNFEAYEIRQFDVPMMAMDADATSDVPNVQYLKVDEVSAKLISKGLQVTFDINNKPAVGAGNEVKDSTQVESLDIARSFLTHNFEKMIGFKL